MIQRLSALILLVISLPLWFALWVVSLFLFGGRFLFRSRRLGKGGRSFYMYKITTMESWQTEVFNEYLALHPECEKQWRESHKLFNDPRCGRWGRFLRSSSLDEIPQLLNVLKGEMNLVGPRPITQEEAYHYGSYLETVQSIKPGITGLWQVSGRNLLSYRQRVVLDVYYARHRCLWLDICILFRTIGAVLSRKGAF